jgi:hypothetical protein
MKSIAWAKPRTKLPQFKGCQLRSNVQYACNCNLVFESKINSFTASINVGIGSLNIVCHSSEDMVMVETKMLRWSADTSGITMRGSS